MLTACITLIALLPSAGDPVPPANTWVRLEKGGIEGRRWDVPLSYAPGPNRFLVLGGRSTFADYRKPRSYDVLALDRAAGQWENAFPAGKDWGPKFGAARA